MVKVKLYVEGGGNSNELKARCREGFCLFLKNAGFEKLPEIIAGGDRLRTYKLFCTAIENKKDADVFLLVDSEAAVPDNAEAGEPESWRPWHHLKMRQHDGWDKPQNSEDINCHLMVQCMESWLAADPNTLKRFYHDNFHERHLPDAVESIESISKDDIMDKLKNATRHCKKKGKYDKGKHSFELLGRIDPEKIVMKSKWARRLVEALKKKLDGQT